MNRFRSHRTPRGHQDDDPTRMLQYWRDQQHEERLVDTQELPALRPPTGPRRRRVPVVVVAGLATLGVVGGIALATTAGRPDAGGMNSTAPTGSATTPDPATTEPSAAPSATDTTSSDDTATPPDSGAPSGPGAVGGPGSHDGHGAHDGPAAHDGPGPTDGGPGAGARPARPPAAPGAG